LERRPLVHVRFAIPELWENMLMDRKDLYLSYAADCQQMAYIIRNEHERLIWLDMAQSWLQLAQVRCDTLESQFDENHRNAA
jgi:hypothetical protein